MVNPFFKNHGPFKFADILKKSKEEGITSYSAALKIAKNRIEAKKS